MSTGTPAVAPAITTFKAKYELAAHDARTIARQLSAFDIIQGARNLTPAEVVNRLHALTLEGSPCPLLVLETDTARAAGTVRVYHAPAVCPNLTDRPHHEWMDRSFISHGDIFNKETDIYEQPADFTSLVSRGTAMRCLHHQQIVTAFHDDPNLQILGPFDAAEPNTEAIITRRICFLPPRFAAQLLDSTMSPRDAYFTITNMVLSEPDDIQDACLPLLRWLQHIVHCPTAHQHHSSAQFPRLVPTTGRQLREHRCTIIFRYLPSLDSTAIVRREAELLATRVGDVAAQLQRQTDQQQAAANERRRDKTVAERWPELHANLANLCGVETHESLPPIWLRLANAKKEDARVVIEGMFEQATEHLPAASRHMRFPIEPSLATLILNARLRMTHVDSLSTGLQPFIFGQANHDAVARAAARSIKYDQALSANASVSLAEVTALTTLFVKDQIPMTPFEGLKTARLLYVAVGTLLGRNHGLTTELEDFVCEYQDANEDFLPSYVPVSPGYPPVLTHALILRWVQVQVSMWFDKQWSRRRALQIPRLSDLFDRIRLREHWEIPLPPTYTDHFRPAAPPALPLPAPILPPSPTPSTPAYTPTPPPPTTPAPAEAASGMVTNSHHNAALFQRFLDMRTAANQRITARRARRNADNVVPDNMCVAWHVVGRCNANCTRSADHRQHTADEDAKLVQWCDEHWHE